MTVGANGHATRNLRFYCAAKEYKDDDIRTRRDVVFDDVRMQMTAKHWGRRFNQKHPPKQAGVSLRLIHSFVSSARSLT